MAGTNGTTQAANSSIAAGGGGRSDTAAPTRSQGTPGTGTSAGRTQMTDESLAALLGGDDDGESGPIGVEGDDAGGEASHNEAGGGEFDEAAATRMLFPEHAAQEEHGGEGGEGDPNAAASTPEVDEEEAWAARITLKNAGVPASAIKALWDSDKAELIEWARSGTKPSAEKGEEASEQPKGGEDSLDAVLAEPMKALTEAFDEETAKSIVSPLRAMADHQSKTFKREMGQVAGLVQTLVGIIEDIDLRVTRDALKSQYDVLGDDKAWTKVRERMGVLAATGKFKGKAMSDLMAEAAKAELAGQTPEQKQKATWEKHAKRAAGSSTPTTQNTTKNSSPILLTRDEMLEKVLTLHEKGWNEKRINAYLKQMNIRKKPGA